MQAGPQPGEERQRAGWRRLARQPQPLAAVPPSAAALGCYPHRLQFLGAAAAARDNFEPAVKRYEGGGAFAGLELHRP